MKKNFYLNNSTHLLFKKTSDRYRLVLAALLTLLTFSAAQAQGPNVIMPASGSNTNTCGNNTTLYDNGGSSGNYADDSDGYTVLQNSGSGIITISGPTDIENSWEFLYIYSGAGVDGTLLQTYTGTQTVNYTGTPGEVVTIRFTSDTVYNFPGFALQVNYTGACEQLTCSGTPAPGNTNTSTAAVCSGISAVLGLQNASATDGISYQWQQSATQNGTYTDISGATGVTYASAITATTWFRANATCSGETTASTPVEVVYTPQGNCYCTPNIFLPCETDIVIGRVLFNTLNNTTGNACTSGNGYADYTADPALTTTLQPGLLYDLSLSFGINYQAFAAWIDMNNDGTFSETERITFSDEPYQGGSAVLPVTIPCNATPGQHRLRIRTTSYTAGQPITPCGYSSYGEAEDYIITIAAPGACSPPAQLAASVIATTTASLAWANPCGGSAWEVFVQTVGAGTPAGSGTAVTSMTYNATGLTPGTNYEFYVRTVCSAGSFSGWSNPVAFQTMPLEQTFGAGVWNVNGYNGSQLDTFAGYYVDTNLYLATSAVWSMSTSPSTAPGYIGVPIDYEAHSYRAMRKGFPVGCYTIQLLEHDDDTAMYINGIQVFEHVYSGGHFDGVIWTGTLDGNSEIEIVTKEFGGNSESYYYFGSGGQTYYVDADNDGFGTYELQPVNACSAPAGYALEGGDCDDNNNAIFPGQLEILENGIDENCNGMFDDEPSAFAPYCGALNYTSAIEPITSLNFAGINNTSSATINGTPPMENFMAVSGNVAAGQSYTMTLKGNTDGDYTSYFTVWIDWNQDTVFNTTTEMYLAGSIYDSNGNDAISAITSIEVPADALPGTTRMRVQKLYDEVPSNPCEGGSYGQTEEYSLIVGGDCTPVIWYADADGDGFGDAATTISACSQPAAYVSNNTDCNDTIAAINPGQAEVNYNGIDDNCNGQLDEGFQLLSTVISQQCGITVAKINSVIQVTTFANITQYRFRTYKVVNGQIELATVQYLERAQGYFNMTQMPSYDYASTYSISIELQRNGIWLGYYGPACQISTPALLDNPNGSGSINPSQCNITLATISTLIATPSLQSATGYRFRVSNATDPLAPGQVQEIERTQNYFALTMLPYYFYGTTYHIEVAVKTNGQFSEYGAFCPISTPAVPMINNCDQHMSQPVNYISTASLNKVTSTRFEVSLVDSNDNPVNTFTVDRTLAYFNFNMVQNYIPGGKYMVRVALRTTGFYSPFGEACFVFAPVSSRHNSDFKPEVLESRFNATVFPNPYAESFSLDLDSTSEEALQIRVYDMIGKLIEERSFEVYQIELAQFGEKYPSGVYNIVLSQGGTVKTLRVIKR